MTLTAPAPTLVTYAAPLNVRTATHRAVARAPMTAVIALGAATALAIAPVHSPIQHPSLPTLHAPVVRNAALINPADITGLVNNLNTALASVSNTVNSAVAVPGQTLTQALDSAVTLNDSLWNSLIRATDNQALAQLLTALQSTSSGALTQLAGSVSSAGDTITLTTGDLTSLLASTLTGSLSTALHAVADVLNNPFALTSYTGLLNAPLTIAGTVLNNGLAAANDLGAAAVNIGGTLVTAVTAQISNLLNGVNALTGAAETALPSSLIDGVLTAVQGIVSAPITAALAGVNGLTTTVTDAATSVLAKLTTGAQSISATWLSDGTAPGAIQTVIAGIGTAPLSPASYTTAMSVLVSAGVATAGSVLHTATSFASVPFTAAANLTNTAASVITNFTDGVATTAAGILQAAGLPSLVYALPHVVAATVNGVVNVVAATTAAGLNTVADALDAGSAITSLAVPAVHALTASRLTTTTATAASRTTPSKATATLKATTATPTPETAKTTPAPHTRAASPATEPASATPKHADDAATPVPTTTSATSKSAATTASKPPATEGGRHRKPDQASAPAAPARNATPTHAASSASKHAAPTRHHADG